MVGQYLQHTYVALDGCNNHGCGFLVVFGVHFSSTINQHVCNLVFITVRDKFGGGDKLVVASLGSLDLFDQEKICRLNLVVG